MGCVPTFEAEEALAGMAVRLGAAQVAGWSEAEQHLAAAATYPSEGEISQVRSQILAGEDPLGEAFCRLRGPAQRRPSGQTFTPAPVVQGMVGWAARTLVPARVVNPGTGSARFLAAAGRCWPETALKGAETDPLAAMIGRATLAAAGMAGRAGITLGDYRSLRLAPARPHPVRGQPALRAPPPDPGRLEELAAVRRRQPGPGRERPGGAARSLLPGHRAARDAG